MHLKKAITVANETFQKMRSLKVVIENARAYVRLLREHIQMEDEILFHMADEVLTFCGLDVLAR